MFPNGGPRIDRSLCNTVRLDAKNNFLVVIAFLGLLHSLPRNPDGNLDGLVSKSFTIPDGDRGLFFGKARLRSQRFLQRL